MTVPESETLRVVSPWVATVRLPRRAPLCSDSAKRTCMVRAVKTPASLGNKVNASVTKLPPFSECSKPSGTLKVTAPGKPVPDTVKVRGADAVNSDVLKAGSDVVLTVKAGATTEPLTATVRERVTLGVAPWAVMVTLPERPTAVDQAAKRTAML